MIILPLKINNRCSILILIKKFKNSWATKRKADWLRAQWVNETCRDLQAKVIKTAAFCHNRALQDLYPDSYRLLFYIIIHTHVTV
jgi:hypothetical protein